ncbi:cytochrome c [Conchiformibius steedae DSM 2580]|uniref:Cytochrome c n=1 Tax=Conchiformibius steedae DSM 2580 TaxID=1121352 RepID=A0AAE9KZ09_9NEIS|nr:cytochrome c [Conchiformibius steedae]QMT34058.1 cytochrome c [Conchiformibius steedae]URD66831.1 cytochrome c [Conchiformibius steedae DSM 2580]
MHKYLVLLGTVLVLGACGGEAPAPQAASAPAASAAAGTQAGGQTFATGKGELSKERSAAFKSFMPTYSDMGKMAKGDDAFDEEKFKKLAASFAKEARAPFDHFANDPDGNGRSLPAVWLQADAFAGERDRFFQAVDALNEAAQTSKLDDIKAAFGAVSASCKSCHEAFRAPE